MKFDVIIIGGSYAGLSAALQLGRARRNVLLVDAGERRNRFASHSHGFLGQDGKAPGDIIAEAKSQLDRYKTVHWTDGHVTDVKGSIGDFHIEIDGRRQEMANRLILAMGVVDELPDIRGLKQRWGQSVFHCPYCHGYELNQGQIGVVTASTLAMHHAMMLPDWGKTTLFTNGVFTPDAEQRAALSVRGTAIEETKIAEISGNADVILTDGRRMAMDGLFTQPKAIIAAQWISKLGCTLQEEQVGTVIHTDAMKQTSTRGVFSCGDIARLGGSVAFAVGDGAMAGIAAHRSLLFPE